MKPAPIALALMAAVFALTTEAATPAPASAAQLHHKRHHHRHYARPIVRAPRQGFPDSRYVPNNCPANLTDTGHSTPDGFFYDAFGRKQNCF